MYQQDCKIVEKEQIKSDVFVLTLESKEIASKADPGQFVEISCGQNTDFILRRPFSIHHVKDSTIKILFRTIGRATMSLSSYSKGDILNIIGPLGQGFEISKEAIIIAGGMGIAPLYYLAEQMLAKGIKPRVLIGAKNKKELLGQEAISELGVEPKIATDDGSIGFKGLVTDLLKQEIYTQIPNPSSLIPTLYACGPEPMLYEVAKIANDNSLDNQLSFERFMACGLGACLSCVCETKKGLIRVCKEGPVIGGEELLEV
ncbi:MAG: dihydroorotate dehydrogenase electron transfer subunit [Actinobacteria bacterium]|nr:MAG: dihydroorotate dehydrogenase electron transfer subunit [Actinomycetota bacterium]